MDKYEEIKQIGKGSFGRAILVKRKSDNHLLVLKEINIMEMQPKERNDAMNEVNLLSMLDHKNIIGYYDSFLVNGCLYIIMEYANAGDISLEIKKRTLMNKTFSEFEILSWFSQISQAIQYISNRNILHRDLKTQNIFLSIVNGEYLIKLGDFGIAKILNSENSLAQTVIGTPFYLSPELIQNEKGYDHKSDIWSLGCVLYELTTLKHAFDAANLPSLVLKILKGSYPPIPSHYSNDLRNLIASMLQIDPSSRPSINEILSLPFINQYLGIPLKPFDLDNNQDNSNNSNNSNNSFSNNNNNNNNSISSSTEIKDQQFPNIPLEMAKNNNKINSGNCFIKDIEKSPKKSPLKPMVPLIVNTPTKKITTSSLISKTPLSKAPLVKTPLTKTPLSKISLSKTPLSKTPLIKTPLTKTPIIIKTTSTTATKIPLKPQTTIKTPITKTPIPTRIISKPTISSPKKASSITSTTTTTTTKTPITNQSSITKKTISTSTTSSTPSSSSSLSSFRPTTPSKDRSVNSVNSLTKQSSSSSSSSSFSSSPNLNTSSNSSFRPTTPSKDRQSPILISNSNSLSSSSLSSNSSTSSTSSSTSSFRPTTPSKDRQSPALSSSLSKSNSLKQQIDPIFVGSSSPPRNSSNINNFLNRSASSLNIQNKPTITTNTSSTPIRPILKTTKSMLELSSPAPTNSNIKTTNNIKTTTTTTSRLSLSSSITRPSSASSSATTPTKSTTLPSTNKTSSTTKTPTTTPVKQQPQQPPTSKINTITSKQQPTLTQSISSTSIGSTTTNITTPTPTTTTTTTTTAATKTKRIDFRLDELNHRSKLNSFKLPNKSGSPISSDKKSINRLKLNNLKEKNKEIINNIKASSMSTILVSSCSPLSTSSSQTITTNNTTCSQSSSPTSTTPTNINNNNSSGSTFSDLNSSFESSTSNSDLNSSINSSSNSNLNNLKVINELILKNNLNNSKDNLDEKALQSRIIALRQFCSSIFGEKLFIDSYNLLKKQPPSTNTNEIVDIASIENQLSNLVADKIYYIKYIQQLIYYEK